jgi:hypothetical protein
MPGINSDFHDCALPGSLDIKGGRRCNLLLNKRWNLLPPFLSNEPSPDVVFERRKKNGTVNPFSLYNSDI